MILGNVFAIVLVAINLKLLTAHPEEVYFNGTHRLANQTKIEVTTVRIAEIVNLNINSINTTMILKEKTAKHFVATTKNSRVVLIPPAMIDAQIRNHRKSTILRRVA